MSAPRFSGDLSRQRVGVRQGVSLVGAYEMRDAVRIDHLKLLTASLRAGPNNSDSVSCQYLFVLTEGLCCP